MHITSIKVQNFRLIKDVTLDLTEKKRELSLLLGKNNSGKTSFIVLLDKFLNSATPHFDFDDFPTSLRDEILNIDDKTDTHKLAISLLLDIHYDDNDSLRNVADFILDLDPEIKNVKILFECTINLKRFLSALKEIKSRKPEYIKKYISNFLETKIYAVGDVSDINSETNRHKLVKKEWKAVNAILNLQVIHAKRDVASSESSQSSKKVLSSLTSSYFNKKNKLTHDDKNGINQSMIDMDAKLDKEYSEYFSDFLSSSKDFLDIKNLNVVSDLQSKGILDNFSKIVYGDTDLQLPEHLNGLGFMNILYLLLQIEIKKSTFEEDNKDINLLLIEEPEAHTHPQMQYVFIENIKTLLKKIPQLQTMITTHSSHIVNKCDFKDIRYFLKHHDSEVVIKNFYTELLTNYKTEKDNFSFVQQYLTLNSSELFFAEKIIFIEGTTEKLLLPLFIKMLDDKNKDDKLYNPISSQNISVLEVGANARAFRHFLDFLEIKTLIITDIDTTCLVEKTKKDDPEKTTTSYNACSVSRGTHTSNYSIKEYLDAPEISAQTEYSEWMIKLKANELQKNESTIRVAYQIEDDHYHARSFEDAFISVNLSKVKEQSSSLAGLQNKALLGQEPPQFYDLTESILKNKSEFASSLLWLALTEDVKWKIPAYIEEGLMWISQK